MAVRAREARERDPLEMAETAFAQVEVDAAGAEQLAAEALRSARARRSPDAEAAALHALAFARYELGDPRSLRSARAAVRVAERHGLTQRAAHARRRLAFDLSTRGRLAAAARELELACADLDAHELARSQVFRIAIQILSGRPPDPVQDSDRALKTLQARGDRIWEARLRHNRGLLFADRGDIQTAEHDLSCARDLYTSLGAHEAAAGAAIELARVALARGDLPDGLARLDRVAPAAVPPAQRADLELLRARALATAHLTGEALAALAAAQAIWSRWRVAEPEGRLEAVRLTLLAGDPRDAQRLARTASTWFARHDAPIYRARADGLRLAAALASGEVSASLLAAARHAAATLTQTGWREEAERIRVAIARAECERGRPAAARDELAACPSLRRRGPVADRIEAWHVEALLRGAAGDPAGAARAVRAGLDLLDRHRAALGASDLRASVSAIGVSLAQVGLRTALERGRPEALLGWSERTRANALRLDPVIAPDDPELRERQRELRAVAGELRTAGAGGHAAQSLVARQAALETAIRRRVRHESAAGNGPAALPDRRAITTALGDRALLELIELDGALSALTLSGGRLSHHILGPTTAVTEQLEWLRFALSRLARLPRGAVQKTALRDGARASAQALDQTLLAPLAETLGERELVIVPTGSLHSLPWAMLPSLRGRALAVAPSAASWAALGSGGARRRGRTVLAAGPGLRHASAELRSIAPLHPRAVTLRGAAATVPAVLRALDGASVAHLVCHGRFRADSPLFSSLELADGPLNVYELQRLRRAPELIILSACDLALSDRRPGDELLGFAAALREMGTRAVIASVVAVPDAAVVRLMSRLHGLLADGRSAATALAIAQRELAPRTIELGGFVCLGRG
ncbi:MAG TPA: CHAT domain-containing protein [Solirubrobacteraceae bacterium]|nr:CHAT domain-containing protein [Solirubrobacteraceae bacterium]